jgi:predicted RNA-binding protein YlqC (UPF0109 family)
MFQPFKFYFPNVIAKNQLPHIHLTQKSFSTPFSLFSNQPGQFKKYQPEVEHSEIELMIENKDIGKIIGRSGSIIQEIRKTSKAKIKIYEEMFGSKRKVKITGLSSNVEIANDIILQKLL